MAAKPTAGQEPFGSIFGEWAGTEIKMYKTGVNDLYAKFIVPNMTYYTAINIAEMPAGYDAYTLVLDRVNNIDG